MQAVLYVLSEGVGIVLAIHLAMNGQVGVLLANPRVGNAVFWIVGAVVAVLIGLTGLAGDSSSLHRLSAVPAYLYGSSQECVHGLGERQAGHAVIEVADIVLCGAESVSLVTDHLCLVVESFHRAVVDWHVEVVQ